MDNEAIERIHDFLSNYDKSFADLTKNQQDKFLLIDAAIQKRLNKVAEAKEVIKENGINAMSISKDTGILRPTFYQQPLFDAYIKSYKTEESIPSQSSVQKLNEENKQLRKQIELFMKKDIYWASKLAGAESKYDNLAENVSNALDILKYITEDASKGLLEIKIEHTINALERDITVEPSNIENEAEKIMDEDE